MESHEDEAFNEIERKAKQRMESVRVTMRGVEDDDIQEYKKPWVGLTEQEKGAIMENLNAYGKNLYEFAQAIEAKLKEKNT